MSGDLAPLLLLWMFSQRGGGGGGGGGGSARARAPDWPTTRSPPPPLPAFVPQVPAAPAAPEPQHGTPLDALHKGAEKIVKTASVLDRARDKARKAATTAARQAAHATFGRVRKGISLRDPFSTLLPSSRGDALVSKSVADVQSVVNARGGTLKRDGLFGPKTAAAWKALAQGQGLPATIERGGPKIARVSLHSWEVLSVPPIP